jgi:hypothetical protein
MEAPEYLNGENHLWDLISTEKTHKKSGNRVNGCHFFERRDYWP